MDSLAQAAAYLQPSLEFVAKLSSIIPVWMMMVMADKHFLGLPLLEGSVWYSPRIPPRFTISSGRGGEHASGSESGRHFATYGSNPLARNIPGSTIPWRFHAQPHGASTTTALTLHQTLEAHDPFFPSSGWLEHSYIGSAVLLVVVISFVAMITSGRGYLLCKSKANQASNTSNNKTPLFAHEQLTEEMEIPICWESILEDILSDHSDETFEDSLDQPSTPISANEDEYTSPAEIVADTAEMENPEEEIPETHNEENGQEEKTETNGADATTTGRKPENHAKAGNENGSESGKAAGKGYSKEGSKVHNKEDGPGEPGNIEDLEISAMGEGVKKKKRRVRQNAKKRAAKRAAAEEARKEVGDASNALLEGPTQREDKDGKPENVELEVVKPEASAVLASAKSRKQDEVAGKDVGNSSNGFLEGLEQRLSSAKSRKQDEVAGKDVGYSSNAFLEGLKQRRGKRGKSKKVELKVGEPKASDMLTSAKSQKEDEVAGRDVEHSSNAFLEGPKQRQRKRGKSKKVEPEVGEPEASDALAATKAQKGTEATARDAPTTGKGGGYSFIMADLHDAIFVAADTAK